MFLRRAPWSLSKSKDLSGYLQERGDSTECIFNKVYTRKNGTLNTNAILKVGAEEGIVVSILKGLLLLEFSIGILGSLPEPI